MYIDLHTHSGYSEDAVARDSVHDTVQAAVDKHITVHAITDHKDFCYRKPEHPLDIEGVQRDIRAAQQHFDGQITLLSGIELGQIHVHPDATDFVNTYDFDVIIGSLHQMPNDIDIYFHEYDKLDCDQFLQEYFKEMQKMIAFGGFDVLAHIDYPLRVMKHGDYTPSFDNYMEWIRPILQMLIDRDIALELNAKGLHSWLKQVGPPNAVLAEYRRLGGLLISIGSDAHSAQGVGSGIPESIAHAKAHGFDSVVYYQNRQPHMVSL